MENKQHPARLKSKKKFSGLQVLAIVGGTTLLTAIVILLAAWFYLFPQPFQPVKLTPAEQQRFDRKLDKIESVGMSADLGRGSGKAAPDGQRGEFTEGGRLRPEKYSEEGVDREVLFTEREINALIATNTDLADKIAVDLADNLVSARMRIPVDPDFPFFGGKTLRVRAGVEIAFREGRPVVIVKGVSLMGVPLPNAWLGGIKNIDLVREFGTEKGFWKAFADGVEKVSVEEGRLRVTLKE